MFKIKFKRSENKFSWVTSVWDLATLSEENWWLYKNIIKNHLSDIELERKKEKNKTTQKSRKTK